MEKPSFIVTGASASGKSTLVREAMNMGYNYLPTHTTRDIRSNEVNGIDGVFLNRIQFEENFHEGKYLEPSLDYAELKSIGVYYGTPELWIDRLRNPNNCASPVAIKMARKILDLVDVRWIHLVCDDSDRYDRLRRRGYDEAEIYARMMSGESITIPSGATLFSSSELKPNEILHKIKEIK